MEIEYEIQSKFNVSEIIFSNITKMERIKDIFDKSIKIMNFFNSQSDMSQYVYNRFILESDIVFKLYVVGYAMGSCNVICIRESNKQPPFYFCQNSLFADNKIDINYMNKALNNFESILNKIETFIRLWNVYRNGNNDKESIERFIRNYPYIMVTHELFDKSCYLYSKGKRNSFGMYNEIYDENDELFENYIEFNEAENDKKYNGLRKMTESHWEHGWKIVDFVRDEEGVII